MAITGMIVANMGGSICVESEPGMGSIFTVELDFCRAEPEMDSESEEIAISSVKCLLVEADPEICECVCEFMNGLGLVPSTAGSGLEAVELMRTAREKGEDYQLVILDRGLAVYDACEAVRRQMCIRDRPWICGLEEILRAPKKIIQAVCFVWTVVQLVL